MQDFLLEKELMGRVSKGDRKAFSVLYSKYMHNLYRYVYLFTKSKETSEEIVQRVFVKIWEKRETLAVIASFKAFIYSVAKNQLLDEIRRNQVKSKALVRLKGEAEECGPGADAHLLSRQYYELMEEAINILPEKRKQIVNLRLKDDLSLDEIAEKLAISKPVVKKQLYKGIHCMREYLNKYPELITVFFLVPLPLVFDY